MNRFFNALNISPNNKAQINKLSKLTGISVKDLIYYNSNNILPTGSDLQRICNRCNLSNDFLKIKMGHFDSELIEKLISNSDGLLNLISDDTNNDEIKRIQPLLVTEYGKLYNSDCIELLKTINDDSIDLVFADPPFNLNKLYPSKINDNLKENKYLSWCESWLDHCVRILKKGGSLFLWNLPKWNTHLSSYLNTKLTFQNWIAVDIKYSLPIKGRLYPSHYSLLYYTKGDKADTFKPDRLKMDTCPHCYKELKDYGGYKNKMNPKGINLSDVWLDIPPVRHKKYKRRKSANELSYKLLDRIIEMSTEENDTIFDPFGGAGTTYIVAELKKRKWIGTEIGPIDDIINRFKNIEEEKIFLQEHRLNLNTLFTSKIEAERDKRGLWTCTSIRKKEKSKNNLQCEIIFE